MSEGSGSPTHTLNTSNITTPSTSNAPTTPPITNNLWDEICREFQAMDPDFIDTDEVSKKTEKIQDDDTKVPAMMSINADPPESVDTTRSHQTVLKLFQMENLPLTPPPQSPVSEINKNTCSPTEYLEIFIFPILLPALEKMLEQAKLDKCFERKMTKFNALDFLTEYLYKNNPEQSKREDLTLWDIPFVKEWIKDHPRPPHPKSLLWTDKEAILIIQSHWRAYKVQIIPEVAELRVWQREWRVENQNISKKVSDFWRKKMPNKGSSMSSDSCDIVAAQPTTASSK